MFSVRRPSRIALYAVIAVAVAAASTAGACVSAAVAAPHPDRVKVTVDALHGDRTLEFRAGGGVANRVELREIPGGIEIEDTATAMELTAGDEGGCAEVGEHTVRCVGTMTFVHVHLADGDDYVKDRTAGISQVVVLGGDGDDDLLGGASVNVLYGENGDDELYGSGTSNNTLMGGAGDDVVFGGSGGDYLTGGVGADHLDGGPGDDHFIEDPGADELLGGAGEDTVAYDHHDHGVKVTLDNVANDGFQAEAPLPDENDNVHDTIEHVVGSPGNDSLTGNGQRNQLDGRGGDDVLMGGGGADILDGGDGSDKLYGEGGDDYLDAQRGSDQEDRGGPGGDDTCVGYDTERDETCEH